MASALALAAGVVPLVCPRRPLDPFAGCAISLWLWFAPPPPEAAAPPPAAGEPKPAGPAPGCHLVSIGASGRLVELWLDPPARRLLLRRTDSGPPSCRVWREVRLSTLVPVRCWCHLAVRLVPCGDVITVSAPGRHHRRSTEAVSTGPLCRWRNAHTM